MTITHRRFHLSAGVLLLVLISADASLAATFTVINLADSGPGSLRQAVLSANAAAGPDAVVFATGLTGTITLTSGEIAITGPLVVAGPGAGVLTVSGDDESRIFLVESPAAAAIDVTLSGLTLTRGHSVFGGGAVLAISENLTILDSVISDSRTGLPFDPPVDGCGGNVAIGGEGTGSLRIVNSTLTGGVAEGIGASYGGNLCVDGASLILERSTLSAGSAHHGGGLYIRGSIGTSTILSSTLSGNEASVTGGGIHLDSSGGSLLLRLTTVSNNTAPEGGSILVAGPLSALQLDHSIVANGAPHDLDGQGPLPATVTANYSLIEAPGTTLLAGVNNLVGIDPLLGPLANNGGPTLTHHPLPGSPVIDSGNPAIPSPPATDQRGFARISGPAIDRGSVEVQAASAIAAIPTLSEWAILALSALLLAAGVWKLRAF